jgi:hypothetical protein
VAEGEACEFRLSRAGIVSAFDLSDASLRALEEEGSVHFDADGKMDVRHFAQAFATKALAIVKDTHRSVLAAIGALAEISTSIRDSTRLVSDDEIGARVMRGAINAYADIMEVVYRDLLDSVGKHVHEDLLESIGRKTP